MRRVVILLCICCLPGHEAFSQALSTRDNYTGSWYDADSWEPAWNEPNDTVFGGNVYINGYITSGTSLCLTGSSGTLIVNDTLVINGDLALGNLSTLYINERGILIIKGNLIITNKTVITTSGYLVITGDFSNVSATYGGSFISNSNPTKVFIAGDVPLINLFWYPAISCSNPLIIPYQKSGCSYGNMADLVNDPVYSFFQSTQVTAAANSNSPVCEGSAIYLNASGGDSYTWSGPDGFSSNEQNPAIDGATLSMSGVYSVTVTTSNGYSDEASLEIEVKENPIVDAGSDQSLKHIFETRLEAVLNSGETGEWSLVSGTGIIQNPASPTTLVSDLSEGENIFRWTVSKGECVASESVVITVGYADIPSVITPNGDNRNDFFMIPLESGPVKLTVFNQWGIVEYSSDDYLNDWTGQKKNGVRLPDDTYFYVIQYKNGNIKKGTVLIKTR